MKELTILFLLKDNKVLLAMKKRGFGKGRWNGVGGKVEPGETIEQAAVRECQEEINVTPRKYKKGAEIIYDEQHKGMREELKVYAFIASDWEGTPNETEEMSPKWFSVGRLPYEQMWDDDPYWLPKLLSGQKLKCRFRLDENDKVVFREVKEILAFN